MLGDGDGRPYPDGVSGYALVPGAVTVWGRLDAVSALTTPLGEVGVKIELIIETDGRPFSFVPTTVTQNPAIPWAAGRRLTDLSGSPQCTSGYSWFVQSGGARWWYMSTAGHCAFVPWNTWTPNVLFGGYYYAPNWPGVGWSQRMEPNSVVCCPPSRLLYDISLYQVNGAAQASRPTPLSHLVANYCPGTSGGCQPNFNGATFSVAATLAENQLIPNSTYLTKSGQTTGTNSGIYRGVNSNSQGIVDNVSACGEYYRDSGAPVFINNGNGTVTAVGKASTGNIDSGVASPSYCPNSWTFRQYTFAFVSTLTAATAAYVVTSST